MTNFWLNRPVLFRLSLIVFLGWFSTACDDDWTGVGTSIQGEDDKIAVSIIHSFSFEATTVRQDSIYARTTSGLLGKVYDPLYGYLESDFICQFYCPAGFIFKHSPFNGQIDSVKLQLYYQSWVGDSLSPVQAKVFALDREPARNFYTHIHPASYCDLTKPLGEGVYTPFDYTVPDTIRYYKDADSVYTFYPQISIRLPQDFGQRFYDQSVDNSGSFSSQEDFNRFFPGLYITTGFGSGNIIRVDLAYINIYYRYALTGSQGQDSLVQASERFGVTREVLQLNRVAHSGIEELTKDNDRFTYLKTPAGVYTRILIPLSEMRDSLEGKVIHHVPFEPSPMPLEDQAYAFPRPPYLLLLPEDSLSAFFENNRIENNQSSFLFSYNATSNTYQYASTTYDSYSSSPTTVYSVMNISGLLKEHLRQAAGDSDLRLALIPVFRQVQTGYSTVYTSSLSHYLYPSGLTLRKDSLKTALPITVGKYGR
ncbi:MAG: DUF4270 domain-containing protein [Tannerellaceae bacterium]|jgi:hypothetical protein|nr:DUF4270 domain-containing protein [Tannerellaceae bacterium]